MPLQAGQLDRQITIQSATEAQATDGFPAKTWANIATDPTVWAQVVPLRGRERFDAQQINAEVDTLFRTRWRSDLTEQMRIVYDSTPYDITALTEMGRRDGLEILTVARIQETA